MGFRARIQKWVVISFSRGSSQPTYPLSPALAGGFFTTEKPGGPYILTLWRAICRGGWGVWAGTRWVIGRQILEGDWGCIPSLLIMVPKSKPHQPLFVWSRSCGWQSRDCEILTSLTFGFEVPVFLPFLSWTWQWVWGSQRAHFLDLCYLAEHGLSALVCWEPTDWWKAGYRSGR